MNEIQKISYLKPASFTNNNDRTYLQTKFIVELLKWGIESKTILNRDHIVKCYCDFQYAENKIPETTESAFNELSQLRYWKKKWENRNEFEKRYDTKIKAMSWFKSNLGAAILKGKILAIPIMDI